MAPQEKLQNFITITARENAVQWVDRNVQADEGTRQVAIIVVAAKIEEIVTDLASGNFGFRKADLYLSECKFEHSKLIHTPRDLNQVHIFEPR